VVLAREERNHLRRQLGPFADRSARLRPLLDRRAAELGEDRAVGRERLGLDPDAAPAAALYAAVNSICACAAKGFAELMLPLTKPGPPGAIPANPVIAAPGLTPRFPSTTVGPLLVTVEPAKTPNVSTLGPRAI